MNVFQVLVTVGESFGTQGRPFGHAEAKGNNYVPRKLVTNVCFWAVYVHLQDTPTQHNTQTLTQHTTQHTNTDTTKHIHITHKNTQGTYTKHTHIVKRNMHQISNVNLQ